MKDGLPEKKPIKRERAKANRQREEGWAAGSRAEQREAIAPGEVAWRGDSSNSGRAGGR